MCNKYQDPQNHPWEITKTFVKYKNSFQIKPQTHKMLFVGKTSQKNCPNQVRRFLVHPAVKQVDDLQGFDQSDLLVKYWFWPNRSFDQILMGVLVRLKSYWPSLFKLEIFIVHLRVIPHICHLDHLHVGGEKSVMWRKFQISIHDKCGEIWNFSTCRGISAFSTQ